MVRRSHRDGLGSASQAPRDCAIGTSGNTNVPTVGQCDGTQGPGPGPVIALPVTSGDRVWVWNVTHLIPRHVEMQERRNPAWGLWQTGVWRLEAGTRVLQSLPVSTNRQEGFSWATHCCLLTREEEGSTSVMHGPPLSSSRDPETEGTALLLMFWVPKTKQKIICPALLRVREWCIHHLPTSILLHLRVTQGILHLHLLPVLAGAWMGWAPCLQPAPRRCLVEGWQGGTHDDKQAKGLQPEWKQQVSSGA